jgi:LacI family transcriptional regulator
LAVRPRIALAFPRGAHQESFIQGVLHYASDNGLGWSYTLAPEALSLSVKDLTGWRGDGVLAAINTPEEADAALRLGRPVVNISSALEVSPCPRSMVDNHAVGRIAAEHLLGRGLRQLGFYGLQDVEYSKQRWLGFVERLAESGLEPTKLLATPMFGFSGTVWLDQHDDLVDWLQALPKPCGVLAVSDYRARHVLDGCEQAEIAVPKELAVLGVDNEQVICDHVTPTLSSVARNDRLEGFRAAELLHALMEGDATQVDPTPTAPLEVVCRESTAAFAVSDPRLRQALDYLVANVTDPITVEELAEHVDVSRRWLEYAFRDALGETPYQYLQRQRLLLAKRLLTDEPEEKVYRVAQRAGFSTVKQFSSAFQRAFGVPPADFRRLQS